MSLRMRLTRPCESISLTLTSTSSPMFIVLDLLHAVVGHLGDVQHAVLAGGQLDEGPEVHDAHNLAQIYVADLDVLGDALDDLARLAFATRDRTFDQKKVMIRDYF